MGVLINTDTTGTWRECMGHKSRPASNSIFSFRLPDGWGLVSSAHVDSHRKAYKLLWLSETSGTTDCSRLSKNYHQRGLKLSTGSICKHYLNQVWYKEEGNINCGVFFSRDDTSCAIWILLTSQTTGCDDFSRRTQASLWAIPLLGPLCFWSQTPGKRHRKEHRAGFKNSFKGKFLECSLV